MFLSSRLPLFSAGFALTVGGASPVPAAQGLTPSFDELRSMVPSLDDGRATEDVLFADLDGDGDLDLAEAATFLRVRINDGDGEFEPLELVLSLPADRIAAGDLDGDGREELVVREGDRFWTVGLTGSVPTLSLLGDFGPGNLLRPVCTGDLDGDGDVDIATDTVVLRNEGDGLTFTAVGLNASLSQAADVLAADLDGDGDLDLVYGDAGSPPIGLFNQGGLLFTQVDLTPLGSAGNSGRIDVADVDGNGTADVWTGGQLLLNDGTGAFTDASASVPSSDPSFRADDALFLDYDGDGDVDLLAVGEAVVPIGEQAQNLFRNDGAGGFTNVATTGLPIRSVLERAATGDVDGDGDQDLVVAIDAARPGLELWLSDAQTGLAPLDASVEEYADDPVQGIVPLDVEGDGLLDFATFGGQGSSGTMTLRRNDGSGRFFDATDDLNEVGFAIAGAAGDFDGDGDEDLILPPGRFLENDGTGRFTRDDARLASVSQWLLAPQVADLDLDGDLDVIGTTAFGPGKVIWENLGDGTMRDDSATIPPTGTGATAFALGDFDGNGLVDAVLYHAGVVDSVALILNTGDLVFVDGGAGLPVQPTNAVVTKICAGDVDGDGDADLFLARRSSPSAGEFPDTIWSNDGTAAFLDFPNLVGAFDQRSEDAVLFDANDDGILDLAVFEEVPTGSAPTEEFPRIRTARNFGSGLFFPTETIPVRGTGLQAFDADGDGDTDLVTPRVVLANSLRQLSWTTAPRIGRTLVLEIRAPAFTIWTFAAASARTSLPVGQLGVLRIDPATIVELQSVLLDDSGVAQLSYAIPPDASLVGTSLFGQAIGGVPARLTNLEIATLSAR